MSVRIFFVRVSYCYAYKHKRDLTIRMRRVYYRYSVGNRVQMYPSRLWAATRSFHRSVAIAVVAFVLAFFSMQIPSLGRPAAVNVSSVPGESYQICNEQSQYLTSPWTYDALASGQQSYTVAQYEALSGYGTTLPSLPSYISSESSTTTAAEIFAPGSSAISNPPYDFPETPVIYFFEGGAYGEIALGTISGDEFIGGSANGYGEPEFNDGGAAGGIDAGNGTYYFSGGASTLAATASTGATTITTSTAISGYLNWLTFSDGSTYQIASASGTTITLSTALTASELSGGSVWASQTKPLAEVTTSAVQGATSVSLDSSVIPLMKHASIMIGDHAYTLTSVSGSQSGYTVDVQGLDMAVAANTPVYYNDSAGAVTVQYLNINDDQHVTTGTIYTGSGWTITNNDIHDGNSKGPGYGVAIYGGDESTIEYNCLSKMGDYGIQADGTNNTFDYNEIYGTNYQKDPGCGCSGGGKWWGTLNANIEDNAFIDDGPGGGGPIWLDNGNSGTLIQGNYFYMSDGSSIASETGFDLNVNDNLFEDSGWGSGTGCGGTNCDGAVNINSSGGFNVPGSRYENQVSITNNQFINDWMGVDIWQAGGRSCQNSGEGWPIDAPYCSGGYPNTAATLNGGQYDFSHITDSSRGGTLTLAQNAAQGTSTILVNGSEALNDQIGFADALTTTTTDTTDVTTLNGSSTITVSSTAGFPSSGELRVGTSAAWSDGNGSFTGAILSYAGTTSTTFTGVLLVRGTGTLSGPIMQVQPYSVKSETCYTNDCAVNISPGLTAAEPAGNEVANSGTCQLFVTAASLPSGPIAPDGTSYWDGCQWQARDISITSNTFVFQPSVITSTPNLAGTSNTCNATSNGCGTNFMQDQYNSGEAPFNDETGANAMISDSSFTGCPSWDTGCTSDPLSNVNGLSSPPGAPVGNGEAPYNNLWANNTYIGPWTFNPYIFGNCSGGGVYMPTDPTTGKSMSASACNDNFTGWQGNFQQDTNSSSNPMVVSLDGLASNQSIHGNSQKISAFEDTSVGNAINSTLSVNGSNVATNSVISSPYSFALDTLGYADGLYTIKVSATDSGSNSDSDSVPVYISNGDLNGDGKVNLSDLAIMAAHWGQADSNYADGNITDQSTINISDLAVLAANWGWTQ